jgi:hypothetical protein
LLISFQPSILRSWQDGHSITDVLQPAKIDEGVLALMDAILAQAELLTGQLAWKYIELSGIGLSA